MKVIYTLALIAWFALNAGAQERTNIDSFTPKEFKENVTVEKLNSDKNQSSFIIWVSDTVKPHYHKTHTECIYLLEGGGTFYMGKKKMELKVGDFVMIPEGVIHSYKHKTGKRSKVLSVQAPEFVGTDRIWVDIQE
ncbi:MAG: hypothetical protein CL840_20290 [Crocinitomicaceae bacterium]|nr:hypothetical protein [Crocinitomicaceae bacterium]|tara:strand:- start:3895 stop:4302 length:408 start_codon:yes stop_codon:yes gene_type:complete